MQAHDFNETTIEDEQKNAIELESKRVKLSTNTMKRFLEPKYPTFQSQEYPFIATEFGVANTDLNFVDITPSYLLGK